MASIIDDIAHALLTEAFTLPNVADGRTGEGGPIPVTPYVEIGDGRTTMEAVSAGAGMLYEMRAQFYVVFYVPYTGANPDADKATLRDLVWGFHEALKSDYSLGGLVRFAHVTGWDIDLTTRERRQYWYAAVETEVLHEG